MSNLKSEDSESRSKQVQSTLTKREEDNQLHKSHKIKEKSIMKKRSLLKRKVSKEKSEYENEE